MKKTRFSEKQMVKILRNFLCCIEPLLAAVRALASAP